MRRVAGVTARRGQVWGKANNHEETLLVIGEPELTRGFFGGSKWVRDLANFLSGLGKTGWCHEVVCLETSRHHFMNESFFAESEAGQPSLFVRLA